MTEKLYDPKTMGVEHRNPGRPGQDLNPNPSAGQNYDLIGPHPEKEAGRTAHENKAAQRHLRGFRHDELRRIPLLPTGMRLEQGATYLDLRDPARYEIRAMADTIVEAGALWVPKSDVDYPLWSRLRGVTDPVRTT